MFGFKKKEKLPEKCPENRTTCCRTCMNCQYKEISKEGQYTIIKCKLSSDNFIIAPFRDIQ